jgi:hypothetical protein
MTVTARPSVPWLVTVLVFVVVLGASLTLVALAGTDIPFHDQWNIEGQWLYPSWLDGTLRLGDLFRPFNEHRIVWSHFLNLFIFAVNRQWDPEAQAVAVCILRAAVAAALVIKFVLHTESKSRYIGIVLGILAFLPHLAWQTVLWGVACTYFTMGFAFLSFTLLEPRNASLRARIFGILAGLAAMLAMAPGELVPVALLGLLILRTIEERVLDWKAFGTSAILVAVAFFLHTEGVLKQGFVLERLDSLFRRRRRCWDGLM